MRKSNVDLWSAEFARLIIKYRLLVILLSVGLCMAIGNGASYLSFANDYRVFFSGENPELNNFEDFQSTYTKNDNILFVLEPRNGNVFTNETLSAVEELTTQAWQIPYAYRVDSISNFQNTYSEGDNLIVEDLIAHASQLSADEISHIKDVALNEPLLRSQLVTPAGTATSINVVLQYPGESLYEVPTAAQKAREIKDKLQSTFPDMRIYITGFSMLNNAFAEAGYLDSINLLPIMYGILILATLVLLRSLLATLATLVVVFLSVGVGMGAGGFSGVLLTPISNSAPIVILTLAIADSIHILISMRHNMVNGMSKNDAIIHSISKNMSPVTITSLTTMVGFISLNLSDAPPYWHLGNMSAVGIIAAWLLSLTLLPALMSLLPFRAKKSEGKPVGVRISNAISGYVVNNPNKIIVVTGILSLVLLAMIPRIELNDQWSDYFDDSIQFRTDTDNATKSFGLYPIEYSVSSGMEGGINTPEYLHKLDEFANYLRTQPHVVHVNSITDIVKRLNMNMHGDSKQYYELPTDHDEAAQFLLLYELSLPYGLDLNDRINIDKSSSRITVMLGKTSTSETKEFINTTQEWINKNFSGDMKLTKPTSAQVMFTYIADRNVESMIFGTLFAISIIAVILVLSLRDFKLGLLSLIPNCLPILCAFGVWSILVGTVGFSVAAVAAIALGIVVDDTVHMLWKYIEARKEMALSKIDSIHYVFEKVGTAIMINTAILIAGFVVMASSTFKINEDLGLLTAITIGLALVMDFLLLPAILIKTDKKEPSNVKNEGELLKSNQVVNATAAVVFSVIVGAMMTLPSGAYASGKELSNLADDEKGYEISALSDRSDRGFNSSEVELTMVLRNTSGEESKRSLSIKTLEVQDEDYGDKSLVIFNEPRDIKGTSLLSHAKILDPDDQWLYLPSLKRIKRISSKNKSGPFIGSEFAFEDLTALELNKYDHAWLKEDDCEELKCDVIVRTPRYEYSGYSKLLVWIDQSIRQVRKVDFYDRRGELLKTLNVDNYRDYAGVWRPHYLKMVNHQTKKETDLLYENYNFHVGLDENDFIKNRLTRIN